jgi:protein phosphatase-4 regulatory subunit 3
MLTFLSLCYHLFLLTIWVQVYELRDANWHDRGTGFCKGVYDDTQDLALLIVINEPEESSAEKEKEGEGGFLKEDVLYSARVESDDIYQRQQGGF